ncbi:MAG: hypothetical protein Kow00108_11570 [Calditrichia bacterium]
MWTAFVNEVKKNKIAYIYILPSFLVLAAVVLYPFIYNLLISVSNMSLTHFKSWKIIGFTHYLNILMDKTFYVIFGKTVLWTVLNVTAHVVLGVFLALILNQTLPGKGMIRTLLVIPWAVPQYITALTWRGLFNYRYGAVNLLLVKGANLLGFSIQPVEWLSSPVGAWAAALITNIWLGFPFMMIIALGGLQSIPKELYEAADIDGASAWQKFKNITLPLLKPVMIPAISLGVIWTFNNFNVIWLVSNGGEPSDLTHILVSYVYKNAFTYYRYGYSAALSMVIFGILLTFGIQFIKKTRGTEAVY